MQLKSLRGDKVQEEAVEEQREFAAGFWFFGEQRVVFGKRVAKQRKGEWIGRVIARKGVNDFGEVACESDANG